MTLNFKKSARAIVGAVTTSAILAGCGGGINSGKGDQIGNISRLQVDGVLPGCSTWEGEMAAISFRGRAAGSSSTLDFHVRDEDKEILAQLQDAMDNMKTVKVEFTNSSFSGPCHQSNSHVVTKVTVMDHNISGPIMNLKNDEVTPAVSRGTAPAVSLKSGDVQLVCQVVEAAAPAAAVAATPAPTLPAVKARQLPSVLEKN